MCRNAEDDLSLTLPIPFVEPLGLPGPRSESAGYGGMGDLNCEFSIGHPEVLPDDDYELVLQGPLTS